jgi:hypothetical protein
MHEEVVVSKGDEIDEVLVIQMPIGNEKMPPRLQSVRGGSAMGKRCTLPEGDMVALETAKTHQYVVLGLEAVYGAATAWAADYGAPHDIFYWSIPVGSVRSLADRYPNIKANIERHSEARAAFSATTDDNESRTSSSQPTQAVASSTANIGQIEQPAASGTTAANGGHAVDVRWRGADESTSQC